MYINLNSFEEIISSSGASSLMAISCHQIVKNMIIQTKYEAIVNFWTVKSASKSTEVKYYQSLSDRLGWTPINIHSYLINSGGYIFFVNFKSVASWEIMCICATKGRINIFEMQRPNFDPPVASCELCPSCGPSCVPAVSCWLERDHSSQTGS